jgi:PEP-CTERM motif
MSLRPLFGPALFVGLMLATVVPGRAGEIQANFSAASPTNVGPDFYTDPGPIGGSRFVGGATSGSPLGLTSGSFQGTVFGWMAVMRFQDQADLDANRMTAVQPIPDTPMSFTVAFNDDLGNTAELTFTGGVSGEMNFANPRFDVTFDNPSGQVTLGDAVIDVSLETVQHADVTPAVTFDGNVSIDGPPPTVTDVVASFAVTMLGEDPGTDPGPPPTDPPPVPDPGPEEPDPTDDGPGPVTPEPGSLVLAGLGLAAAATYRRRLGSKR